MWAYSVDIDALDSLVARIVSATDTIDRSLGSLDARVASLRDTWSGEAADAHQAAHVRWQCAAQELRAALVGLGDSARRSHSHYSAALRANATMWGGPVSTTPAPL